MTKLDTLWQDIIPDFDVLKWKQETQAEILRETEGMTNKEVCAYFHKASEEFQAEGKRYQATRATESQT
jgi:hypothetical protein